MKKLNLILFIVGLIIFVSCINSTETRAQETKTTPSDKAAQENNEKKTTDENFGNIIHLTKTTFLEKVMNFEKNKDVWVYEGDKPCIIDFYADWCKPCKLIAPIMEELAVEYAGQICIYKVNTQKEPELAAVFGIRTIPSVLFCPMKDKPQMAQGVLPKETFKQVIDSFLLKVPNTK